MRPRYCLFPASILVLAACGDVDRPAGSPGLTNPPVATDLTLTRLRTDSIAFAQYSGLNTPENFVIRDAAAWDVLWHRIYATSDPMPALPDIDFTQEMIVGSALGTRTSGGYDVLLTQATEDSGRVRIQVLETRPGAGCAVTLALTQPIDLGRVPRRDGPVDFLVTQHTERCGP
jgi:hypothetical protein